MKELIDKTSQDLLTRFGGPAQLISQAPGRINIIGEHVDYTGGFSLPAAINRWTVAAWKIRSDRKIRIYSANMNEVWETSWEALEADIDKNWKKYVGGALSLFRKECLSTEAKGFDLSLAGNVPLGKGVSSSASIELALLNGLNELYHKGMTSLDLALMAQQVEHRFLKVKSGLLDQFASQFSKIGHALLIDFEDMKRVSVALSPAYDRYSWVIIDSMVERELAGSKYSERVEECAEIQKWISSRGKKNIRDVKSEELEGLFREAPEVLRRRARHIVTENERTLAALDCLGSDRTQEMGDLLKQSHLSLARNYEVSHPNLDFLVETGCDLPGVAGGRMMGGGFGGCCIFLVEKYALDVFGAQLKAIYRQKYGIETDPLIFDFVAGASAFPLNN